MLGQVFYISTGKDSGADRSALNKQVMWTCRVFEFLAERGQREGKCIRLGQPMADELQNPKK